MIGLWLCWSLFQGLRQQPTDDSSTILDRWVVFLLCNVLPVGYDKPCRSSSR